MPANQTMYQPLFMQNTIACIWDFDKTLIPGYMQAPLFAHFKVDERRFWAEVARLPDAYRQSGLDMISSDTVYLNHILTYVKAGIFKGLNNELLRRMGAKLEFYPGLPDFFEELKACARQRPEFRRHDIQLEHYVISTGLRQLVLGSRIAPYIDGRVQSFGEANYIEGSQTAMWLKNAVTEIAGQIVKQREQVLGEKVGRPPKHLNS